MMTTTAHPNTDLMERHIQMAAFGVTNSYGNRLSHPTYGYTKTSIREQAQRMDGMIYLYGVLTGQGLSPIPALVRFTKPDTSDAVRHARICIKDL